MMNKVLSLAGVRFRPFCPDADHITAPTVLGNDIVDLVHNQTSAAVAAAIYLHQARLFHENSPIAYRSFMSGKSTGDACYVN